MSCEDCENDIHGWAEITPSGRVICACCRMTLAEGVIADRRSAQKTLIK
jgi:hypothetical protein